MDDDGTPYYRRPLATIHDRGFASHADGCAPAVLDLLAPVRDRGGVVLELGCGSGALTRHLVATGHRVIATDASPAMLDLARTAVPGAERIDRLVLPDDPLPDVDAVVSVGHVLNYLLDEPAIGRALDAIARALRPRGVLVLDLCDLRWAEARRGRPPYAEVRDDWALVTRFSVPRRDRYVREMTTFVRGDDGTWSRDDERHVNVLLDTATVPTMLAARGVEVEVRSTLGDHLLPDGLVAVVGRRPAGV